MLYIFFKNSPVIDINAGTVLSPPKLAGHTGNESTQMIKGRLYRGHWAEN
jgi:hypothetical protein